MYHYLTGKLIEKSATAIVLDVGGMGFYVQIPLSTFEHLPSLNQPVKILTHFVVREDAHSLFGFITQDEKTLFKHLISVSGIGPKLAITVLSGVPIEELKRAIVDGSVESLKKISGIGKKTAERLVIELREKIVLEGQSPSADSKTPPSENQALIDDSMEALIALGYRKQNAKAAIEKALEQGDGKRFSVEGLIRSSLKFI